MLRKLSDFGGRLPGAASLLALAGYAFVVGAGGYLIADFAERSARTATHAIDAAIKQAADAAEISADPQSALPRALRTANRITAAEVAESAAFTHARPAPRFVEQLDTQHVEQLKQQVSERVVEDDSEPWFSGEQQTYRTMCVRMCDGAYFQVSYSTTRDRFQHDESACAARCGSPTKLFYQRNPGGSPETMKDRSGRSYLALPTAFQFRRGSVSGCGCRAEAWEQASKDRHRLYALEQQQADGKSVDVAELSRLRQQVATAAGSRIDIAAVPASAHEARSRDDGAASALRSSVAEVSFVSARTVVSMIPVSLAAPVTTATLPADDAIVLDAAQAVRLRPTEDGDVALKPIDSTPSTDAVVADKIPASKPDGAQQVVSKGAWSRNSASFKRTKADRQLKQEKGPLVLDASLGPAEKNAVQGDEADAAAETDRQSAAADRPDATGKKASKSVKAGKTLKAEKLAKFDKSGKAGGFGMEQVVLRKLPIEVAEKPIWGVGRNARHLTRGGSAFETFARNFY